MKRPVLCWLVSEEQGIAAMAGTGQHVVPRDGRWAVRKGGAERVTRRYDTQREAVDAAREDRAKAANRGIRPWPGWPDPRTELVRECPISAGGLDAASRSEGDFERSAFDNCPFDEDYEPILPAVLFCLARFGLRPRIALVCRPIPPPDPRLSEACPVSAAPSSNGVHRGNEW